MSEQNKDKLSREDWIKHEPDPDSSAENRLPEGKSVDDWEKIALRGRSLLKDESEARSLLDDLDHSITQQFGGEEKTIKAAPKSNSFRWLSIAASIVFVLLAAWWLWPKKMDNQQLYVTYFTHLDNDLSVNLMGDTPADALTESLRPYNARRYEEAARRIGAYLDQNSEPAAIRLYYGISLLESGSETAAIEQLTQLKNNPNNRYKEATDWYLALAYLKSDQIGRSKLLLQKIADAQHPYASQAKALLQRL